MLEGGRSELEGSRCDTDMHAPYSTEEGHQVNPVDNMQRECKEANGFVALEVALEAARAEPIVTDSLPAHAGSNASAFPGLDMPLAGTISNLATASAESALSQLGIGAGVLSPSQISPEVLNVLVNGADPGTIQSLIDTLNKQLASVSAQNAPADAGSGHPSGASSGGGAPGTSAAARGSAFIALRSSGSGVGAAFANSAPNAAVSTGSDVSGALVSAPVALSAAKQPEVLQGILKELMAPSAAANAAGSSAPGSNSAPASSSAPSSLSSLAALLPPSSTAPSATGASGNNVPQLLQALTSALQGPGRTAQSNVDANQAYEAAATAIALGLPQVAQNILSQNMAQQQHSAPQVPDIAALTSLAQLLTNSALPQTNPTPTLPPLAPLQAGPPTGTPNVMDMLLSALGGNSSVSSSLLSGPFGGASGLGGGLSGLTSQMPLSSYGNQPALAALALQQQQQQQQQQAMFPGSIMTSGLASAIETLFGSGTSGNLAAALASMPGGLPGLPGMPPPDLFSGNGLSLPPLSSGGGSEGVGSHAPSSPQPVSRSALAGRVKRGAAAAARQMLQAQAAQEEAQAHAVAQAVAQQAQESQVNAAAAAALAAVTGAQSAEKNMLSGGDGSAPAGINQEQLVLQVQMLQAQLQRMQQAQQQQQLLLQQAQHQLQQQAEQVGLGPTQPKQEPSLGASSLPLPLPQLGSMGPPMGPPHDMSQLMMPQDMQQSMTSMLMSNDPPPFLPPLSLPPLGGHSHSLHDMQQSLSMGPGMQLPPGMMQLPPPISLEQAGATMSSNGDMGMPASSIAAAAAAAGAGLLMRQRPSRGSGKKAKRGAAGRNGNAGDGMDAFGMVEPDGKKKRTAKLCEPGMFQRCADVLRRAARMACAVLGCSIADVETAAAPFTKDNGPGAKYPHGRSLSECSTAQVRYMCEGLLRLRFPQHFEYTEAVAYTAVADLLWEIGAGNCLVSRAQLQMALKNTITIELPSSSADGSGEGGAEGSDGGAREVRSFGPVLIFASRDAGAGIPNGCWIADYEALESVGLFTRTWLSGQGMVEVNTARMKNAAAASNAGVAQNAQAQP